MAQFRYHNWEAPLSSIDENNRLVGLAYPARYAGFDALSVVAGSTMQLTHMGSGAKRLKEDGSIDEGPFGVIVTRQGTVVYDDSPVIITIPFITTNPRIDVIVAQHTHLDSPGGASLTYSRIAGAEAVNPSPPALSNPLIQVKIGEVKVYSALSHATTVWYPAQVPKLGGEYAISKTDEKSVHPTRENDFNTLNKTGVYSLRTTVNAPTQSTPWWICFVTRRGTDILVQMAFNGVNGRAYVRAATNFSSDPPTNWQPWNSLSNVEVPGVDFTPVMNAMGNRQYTQENYVANDQSLTLSVDALDMALKAMETLVDGIHSGLTNVSTSLLARFSALNDDSGNIDNFKTPGVYYINDRLGGAGGTWPWATGIAGTLLVTRATWENSPFIIHTKINQVAIRADTGAIRVRYTTDTDGMTWSAWA